MSPVPTLKIIESLGEIPAPQWNALAGSDPFLSNAFLPALQESGCATPETCWRAQFMTLWQGDHLVGAMPLYLVDCVQSYDIAISLPVTEVRRITS